MKPLYKLFALTACLLAMLSSCKKHDYYLENPNNPSSASSALLLTNICVSTFNGWPADPAYASRHLTYYERPNVNINYGWGASAYGAYDVLRQIQKMDEMAQKTGEVNYRGLAKFFRAVHFISLTESFGDVPYSDALKALEGVQKPKYDAQEDIYAGVLNELEEANSILDPSKGTLAGDIIYGSKSQQILQWKKLVNAYRLRILIHLSKKENNAKLNVKQQFQSIISNPDKYPLMTGNADNGQLVFNTSAANNSYPLFQSTTVASLVSLEKGFVTILKDRNDSRLFSFGDPISGMAPNVFSSYEGVDAGLTVANQQTASKNASRLKRRYVENQVNEPLIFMGFAEQQFLIAEAISRGWIPAGRGSYITAEQNYNAGIDASFAFYGIPVATYKDGVKVKFDSAKAIEQIITQKYIASFMNSFWEPFLEQRRTGFPTFSVGPGTLNGGQIPKRWKYPQAEYTINKTNIEAAVQRQYTGSDNINGVMWVLQ
ncbi:SusD/RagB family nutrient-binding outer membrane lipoprotein [Solitalea lacus]|uniref:SusD/RagB family nutrient-binding outer membrane lipoprotein n=1 Tax=Solitalea lacus TaxID=2911172 RepID=UPI001EDB80B9|nr:SusD/RagB family nutrient-binding outer membrane lipoprotein [Solitalea lacus]UKJ06812.1 SusD/RagB family nutrient-binding outer membrane lipoprotein [Solitalea lacus]